MKEDIHLPQLFKNCLKSSSTPKAIKATSNTSHTLQDTPIKYYRKKSRNKPENCFRYLMCKVKNVGLVKETPWKIEELLLDLETVF